jgi:stage II sporulation protein D
MHRRFWGLLVAVIAFAPMAPARATIPVVVIDGRGWGHGVGMAQDGAFWMAKAGASTPQILGQFYPGTAIGKANPTSVRVGVFNGGDVTVAFPDGGRIDQRVRDDAPGFPIRIDPGGRAHLLWRDGRVLVADIVSSSGTPSQPASQSTAGQATTTTTTTHSSPSTTTPTRSTLLLPAPTTTTTTARRANPGAPPSATSSPPSSAGPLVLTAPDGGALTLVDRQRSYRGFLDVLPTDGGFRVVDQLDIEQYLRGMGEVRDPSWPAAALRTQAIAARTYALRAMAAAGEICDTTRCQVYLGRQAEYSAMDKAVAATAGQVILFNKALASAVYSANAGGHSASREEGFGTTGGNYPYLRAAPYETKNPMPWTVTVAVADVAARLGRVPITDITVETAGPSGRALSVVLDGPDGRHRVSGLAFASALGLRSTMFALHMATADVAPPPPSGGSALQTPPEEIAAVAAPALDDAVALRPSAIDLPDRPRPPAVHAIAASHRVPGGLAWLELLLAVAVIVVASARKRDWRT